MRLWGASSQSSGSACATDPVPARRLNLDLPRAGPCSLYASQAGGFRFEFGLGLHSTFLSSARVFLSSRCQRRHRQETVSKLALAGQRRKGSSTMLVRLLAQLRQCFPHHVQLRLAVALEHLRVALPQHLRHEMIRHSPRAQPGCKRVALIPSSELQAFFCSYPPLTRLPCRSRQKGEDNSDPPKRRGSCGPPKGTEFHASIRPHGGRYRPD